MIKLLSKIDTRLAQAGKAVNGFVGTCLFLPAFTMLTDTSTATAVLDAVCPHAPPVATKIMGGCLTAAAGYFLSHTVRETNAQPPAK